MQLCNTFLILLSTLALSYQSTLVGDRDNVTNYLNRKLRETKVNIAKDYIKRNADTVLTPTYDVEWEKLWTRKLHSERPLTIKMFNKMFILEGNRLMSVALRLATNKTRSELQRVAQIRSDNLVKFVKSIVWKSTVYLLFCFENADACSLYTGRNDLHLVHRQIIKHKGSPTDANFFSRAKHLYLVVAHNIQGFSVPSVIYHWTGTYMDVIEEIATVGAVSVTTFNHEKSTFIVFGQNVVDQPDVGSEVYEFNKNGIARIQYLATNGPTSIHHYIQNGKIFLFVTNHFASSTVYWWEGKEFLHWHDLPDIVAPTMINVAHVNEDTLFFVSYENSVTLYKVTDSEYSRLVNFIELNHGEKIVDVGVWMNEKSTLTLLLVSVDSNNLYRIEPWELRIKKNRKNEGVIEAVDLVDQCLTELGTRLVDRMEGLKILTRDTWPLLLSSTENVVADSRRISKIKNLILDSGNVGTLKVVSNDGILLSSDIEKALNGSVKTPGSLALVNEILSASQQTMKIDRPNRIVGNVTVLGNAFLQRLQTHHFNTSLLNQQQVQFERFAISNTRDQNFGHSQLRGRNITVRDLKIDQLCGIPYDYWLTDPDEKTSNIFLQSSSIDIVDDTIRVQSAEVFLRNLQTKNFGGIDVDKFFNDIFIVGKNQVIRGNLIQKTKGNFNIKNLVVDSLNSVNQRDLLTINSNNKIYNDVYIKSMLIRNIIARKINGVLVTEAAMVSKKNYIRGKVTAARIKILEEMSIENQTTFPKVRPVQVYDQVKVIGLVKATAVKLVPFAQFLLTSKKNVMTEQVSINEIFETFWTKRTEQTIKIPVTFESGMTVDELNVKYLNDVNLSEDVIFTDTEEISPQSGYLEFGDLRVNSLSQVADNQTNQTNLYEDTDETLVINRQIRLEQLATENLYIKNYNGIPIEEIIMTNRKESYAYPDTNAIQKFDSVTINGHLETQNLHLNFLNGQCFSKMNFLQADKNYKINHLKSPKVQLSDVVVIAKTSNFLKNISRYIEELKNSSVESTIKEIKNLKIVGDLDINSDLEVFQINHKSAATYLRDLTSDELVVNSDDMIVDRLNVRGNLTMNLLRDMKFERLIEKTLSRSRDQNLGDSEFSFFKVSVDELTSDSINDQNTSMFIYADDSEINFNGNVEFSNLHLSLDEADVQTKTLNGYKVNEVHEKLNQISRHRICGLTVNGNVTWKSSKFSGRIEEIITKGLVERYENLETSPQIITGETIIKSERVTTAVLIYKKNEEILKGLDLRKIIIDSVVDDPEKDGQIEISSKKNFQRHLTADRLDVDGEIGIEALNTWQMKELNSTIVRKETLNSFVDKSSSKSPSDRVQRQQGDFGDTMIFGNGVTVRKLVIKTGTRDVPIIHGVPLNKIAMITAPETASDRFLPNNTLIKHLAVTNEAVVKSLDGVNLDEFIKNRVTLNSDQVVEGNLQFNGRTRVLENASIRTINSIPPSDLVINNLSQVQIITGNKSIQGSVVATEITNVPLISGINLKEAYSNSVLNNENVEIFGDLIFQSDIERAPEYPNSPTFWHLDENTDAGFVNGIRIKSYGSDRDNSVNAILQSLKKKENNLKDFIAQASNVTVRLPEIFNYLELENNLRISVANVVDVRAMKIGELTKLNMYANVLGSFCHLSKDECPCRRQYVAEIAKDFKIRQFEDPKIFYDFHDPNGSFRVTVETSTVTSSKVCATIDQSITEFTRLSWIKNHPGNIPNITFTHDSMIHGYLSDAKFFTVNDLVFIVLAIYYDPSRETHETNSLIYVLDLATSEVTLHRSIATSRATAVQVFEIPNKGVCILFSSLEPSEFGKSAETLLYRMELNNFELMFLASFPNGGNRHARNLAQWNDEFIILDDVATNSVNIYKYNEKFDNFYHLQSLRHDSGSPIASIEIFYAGKFRYSKGYITVTTRHDEFFIYEHTFAGNFLLIGRGSIKEIVSMVPFQVAERQYLFVGRKTNSTVFRIVQQGHE